MKKFFAAALVAVLIFAMSVTAFAAESIRIEDVNVSFGYIESGSGNIIVNDFTKEEASKHRQSLYAQRADIAKAIGVQNLDNVKIVGLINIFGNASVSNPLTLSFNVPGVKANNLVNILHFVNGKWEVLPGIAGDGTITGTFTSLSPIAFAVQPNVFIEPPIDNPSYETTINFKNANITVADGNATIIEISKDEIDRYREILIGNYFAEEIKIENIKNTEFIGPIVFSANASAASPTTLTFNVPGVKATDIVNILRYSDGRWEYLPGIAGDGTVTGTFTSVDPIMFAVQRGAAVNPPKDQINPEQPDVDPQQPSATDPTTNDAAPEAPADANTSPKTADNGIALFVIAGLAAAAGIVAVSRRKVEE